MCCSYAGMFSDFEQIFFGTFQFSAERLCMDVTHQCLNEHGGGGGGTWKT